MITYIISKIENYIIDIITSILESIFNFTVVLCTSIDNFYTNLTKKQQLKSYIISNNFIIIQNSILYLLNCYNTVFFNIQDYTLFTIYSNIDNITIYNLFSKLSNHYNLDIIQSIFII
uniref:Uncharacterized protein n=1 Tax=Babesia motasi TaxID=237580 RepID=A0A411ADF0_9APIC|nr:hypothetical protein [Babesia motasi]QAX27134.1 hypothetical protein [Babesia motasi]